MPSFDIPQHSTVSTTAQRAFTKLELGLGFVPNLYKAFAFSDTALTDYLAFQQRKTTLSKREREVINIVVSALNDCAYCREVHNTLAALNGFTSTQLEHLRTGQPVADERLDRLAELVSSIVVTAGHPERSAVDAFLAAGWTQRGLVDVVMQVGEKTMGNYLYGVTQLPIDFPPQPRALV